MATTLCLLLSALSLLPSAVSLLMAQTASDTRPEPVTAPAHPSGWWPNRDTLPRSAYAGPQACAGCHSSIAESWEKSQMAHAMQPASESQFLRANPNMSFQHGPYTYRVAREGDQSVYSVNDANHTLSVPLLWAYGLGVVGQAFVFRINDTYYEAEVAYYPVLHRLSIVAGLPDSIPPTLQEAFGLPLVPVAAQQCISCHTTAAVTSGQLHVDTMIGGVTCEACHGPGAQHVSLMERQAKNRRLGRSLIFNPAVLDPVNLENFCGECHRTSRLVMAEDLHGLDTIHYEPYRLEMSQCWIMTRRITCVTCHDPHQPLQHDPGSYDPACLSCHPSSVMDPARRSSAGLQFGISRAPEDAASPKDGATSEATARVPAPVPLEALIPSRDDEGAIDRTYVAPHTRSCPVANANCITCHMPKCSLPLAPFTMSDHFIRIVTRNDACSTE